MSEHDDDFFPAQVQKSQMVIQPQGNNAVESVRAIEETRALIGLAKMFPRDIVQAVSDITRACERSSLAEVAYYALPRGKNDKGEKNYITGESIRLAETLAQIWGNITYQSREVSGNDKESTHEVVVWDLQSNLRIVQQFNVKYKRKKHGNIVDELDPREQKIMVAAERSKVLRDCILRVIPAYIREGACATIDNTLKNPKEPLIDRVTRMCSSFDSLGIPKEQIEKRLGHPVTQTDEHELKELRRIYTAIRDGAAPKSEFFFSEEEKEKRKEQLNSIFDDKKVEPPKAEVKPEIPTTQTSTTEAKPLPKNEPVSKTEKAAEARLRDELLTQVFELCRKSGGKKEDVHARAETLCGKTLDKLSIEELKMLNTSFS